MEGMEQKITMPANEESKETTKENDNKSKKPVNQRPKSEYKAYGNFVKVDPQIAEEAGTKEPKIAYGKSKEDILKQYQKFNQERMQENDSVRIFDTCSIGQLNPETGKYENYIRYDVATGEEIPNIYLKLPYTKDKELFDKMRAELKENGARFDAEKKQWYVGADADLSKLEKYLPGEAEETKEAPAKEADNQQPTNTAANQEAARIYLELPYMEKEEFQQTVAELKENGARFDAEKKQWYVGADADLSKLEKYLPGEAEETKEAPAKGADNQQPTNTAANQEAARIYLELPYMEKEEFQQTVAELKENGAKFDSGKKQWYVRADAELSKFEKYLPKEEQQTRVEESESTTITKEDLEEIRKDVERIENTQYWPEDIPPYSVSDMKYEITLDDGAKKIDISVKDIKDFGEMNAGEQIDALDKKIREHLAEEKAESDIGSQDMPAEVPEKNYDISVSKDEYDNRCTIWFHDERKEINLIGDQFGVHFPSMEANEVSDLIENYLNNLEKAVLQNQETQIGNYAVGEQVRFYVPEYTKTDGLVNKSGIQEVSGTIIDKQPILQENLPTDNVALTIRQENGQEVHINSDEIYTNSQVEVLKRAMEDKLPPEKFEIVSSTRFSAAQMEEIRFGFKDGLNEDQVTNYAKPYMEARDMDLYRYGQIHGLKPEQIEKIIQTEKPEKAAWADKRRDMDKEIHSNRCQMAKSINQQGFKANPQLVKNIETLNHLTKKENSIKDISEAYKNQTMKERPECQELVDKIGNELKLQELTRNVPCQ